MEYQDLQKIPIIFQRVIHVMCILYTATSTTFPKVEDTEAGTLLLFFFRELFVKSWAGEGKFVPKLLTAKKVGELGRCLAL